MAALYTQNKEDCDQEQAPQAPRMRNTANGVERAKLGDAMNHWLRTIDTMDTDECQIKLVSIMVAMKKVVGQEETKAITKVMIRAAGAKHGLIDLFDDDFFDGDLFKIEGSNAGLPLEEMRRYVRVMEMTFGGTYKMVLAEPWCSYIKVNMPVYVPDAETVRRMRSLRRIEETDCQAKALLIQTAFRGWRARRRVRATADQADDDVSNATLSEGVWKITYTHKNHRNGEIITSTATWLLKEGRRGFAVKRMCTDGKFREKRWDEELVEVDDGKYLMLDSGVGKIRVENYQRV